MSTENIQLKVENVTVKTRNEDPLSNKPARIIIFKNGSMENIIIARIERKKGADGRFYPCVVFEELE